MILSIACTKCSLTLCRLWSKKLRLQPNSFIASETHTRTRLDLGSFLDFLHLNLATNTLQYLPLYHSLWCLIHFLLPLSNRHECFHAYSLLASSSSSFMTEDYPQIFSYNQLLHLSSKNWFSYKKWFLLNAKACDRFIFVFSTVNVK